MKSKLMPFIILIMSLISCSKKEHAPEIKSLDVPKELIGNWLWSYDYGGVYSKKYTTQSTGTKIEIQFDADYNYNYLENDLLLFSSIFILSKGASITGSDTALIINKIPNAPKSIVLKGLDSLIMYDEWQSGYEHHFSRLK